MVFEQSEYDGAETGCPPVGTADHRAYVDRLRKETEMSLVELERAGQFQIECEVWSRIVGYIRPLKNWATHKQLEFRERKTYRVDPL